jgi:hypothetical protein
MAIGGVHVTGSQLPVKVYTRADGLPSNRVNKVVLDSQGYLRHCPQEGLSRLDGYGFTNYGPQQGLPANGTNDLLERRTGEYRPATNVGLVSFDPTSAVRKSSGSGRTTKRGAISVRSREDGAGGL